MKKTLFLIDGDASFIDEMRRRLLLEAELELAGSATAGMDGYNQIGSLRPDVVILAANLSDVNSFQLLSALKSQLPHTKFIVTVPAEDPGLTSQAAQHGADQVITKTKPLDMEKVLGIIKKTLAGSGGNVLPGGFVPFTESAPAPTPTPLAAGGGFPLSQQPSGFPSMQGGGFPQPRGGLQQPFKPMPGGFPQMQPSEGESRKIHTLKQKIIAVNCPKGGVGKSTISKELAQAYATATVNGERLSVCLVDCDVKFGDIANILRLNPRPNLVDWTSEIAYQLQQGLSPDQIIKGYPEPQVQRFLLTHPQTGLKVLAAPDSHSKALDIEGVHMEIVLRSLRNCGFDVIILDTGNNTDDVTFVALDHAQDILLPVTVEVTAIQDSRQLLQTLVAANFPIRKMQLIINRYPKDADFSLEDISQALQNMPIIGVLPEYPQMRRVNNDAAAVVLGKDNEYSIALRQIAHKLVPVFGKSGRRRGGKAGGGLFSRLFRRK